mgnify:CR=1 FL=1
MADHAECSLPGDPVQLVAPDGVPTSRTDYRRDLPSETLSWLYELMVVTRDVDAEFVNLQRQGELALYASCRGQEAAQIGAAACLRKTDWLFPQYRELGAFLLRGITPAQVGAVWRGSWHGGLGFTEKCCAPVAIPIGTHGLHAVGAAMAAQRLGEDSVTVAVLGDGEAGARLHGITLSGLAAPLSIRCPGFRQIRKPGHKISCSRSRRPRERPGASGAPGSRCP